jgi:hypothetical protein
LAASLADLLADGCWENGLDEDGNGYREDLVGWDFVNNDNDPFDDSGHEIGRAHV